MKPLVFFLNPNLPAEPDRSIVSRTKFFLEAAKFQLFGFLILGVILFIDSVLASKFGYKSIIRESLNKFNDQFINDPISRIVLGCLVGPVIEEIAFRAFLNFKKLYVSLSIAGLSYIILRMLVLPVVQVSIDRWMTAVVSLLVAILFFSYTPSEFYAEMKKKFKVLFYSSTLVFVLVHLSNYDISQFRPVNYATIPILLFPQIIASINLSYLRIYCGLLWSVIFHCLLNTIIFSLVQTKSIF